MMDEICDLGVSFIILKFYSQIWRFILKSGFAVALGTVLSGFEPTLQKNSKCISGLEGSKIREEQ